MAPRKTSLRRQVARPVVLGIIALLAVVPGRAASPVEAQLPAIVDLFYDLQFDAAEKAADKLAAEHPGDPAGPFFQSVVMYQRFAAGDARDGRTMEEFQRRSRAAVDAAQAWISTDAARGEYYLGAAHGFRARVFAAQRKYLRALPEALSGVRHLKKALNLDPGLEDAYLGLGMYHYYRARMPAAAKPFAFLITGEGADAAQGLAELRRVAERGGSAKMEARSVLAAILASDRERAYDESATLLGGLMERYPHNPLYRLRRVYVAEERGRYDDAAGWADPESGWIAALDASLRDAARKDALYRAAEAAALAGRRDDARRRLELLASDCPADLKPWVERRRADLAAGRADAVIKPWTGLESPR